MASDKGMVSMMHEERVFAPSKEVRDRAHIKSIEEYRKLYQESLEDPEGFWGRLAQDIEWFKKWDTVMAWKKLSLEDIQ